MNPSDSPELRKLLNLDGRVIETPTKASELLKYSPIGDISGAMASTFRGINHRQVPPVVSKNRDFYGLTFFTRPDMNLMTENLRQARLMYPLLAGGPTASKSVYRAIRMWLDPMFGREADSNDLVNPFQAFIPLLTNNLLSISGWPEVVAPIYTSKEGVYKEQVSYIDGITQNYSSFPVTANFRNIESDPITKMFFYWVHYGSLCYQGILVPRTDNLISTTVDYNTRIFRLVLDSTKTYVREISSTIAIPGNSPVGPEKFNFESDQPINTEQDQISINFTCSGAVYNDPLLLRVFNMIVELFQPNMRGQTRRDAAMKKIPISELMLFNNSGYPRINEDTWELEWYVETALYNQVWNDVRNGGAILPSNPVLRTDKI